MARPKITPFLWFDNQAEDAARFYVSLFPGSKILGTTPGPDGKPLVVEFQLAGQRLVALNGGPHYRLTEAFSLSIDCPSQAEVDELWEKLSAGGGSTNRCGWLKDRFGLSWQVVPTILPELLHNPDREIAGRVMQAMLKMTKLDIAALQAAANSR
jgi:predicted 3-demethylubiquinone-9 3-methyltransferase (glyoxalase superfamily)